MEWEKALKVCEIVKEIKINKSDIDLFKRCKEDGIKQAQITLRTEMGSYYSSVYEGDRIDVLLDVLKDKNNKLLMELAEL